MNLKLEHGRQVNEKLWPSKEQQQQKNCIRGKKCRSMMQNSWTFCITYL